MINIKHLIKVSLVWVNVVYVFCFVGVALFPSLRTTFMKYALHSEVSLGQNFINAGSFIAGLIWWNVIVLAGVWLFAVLFNKIKQ